MDRTLVSGTEDLGSTPSGSATFCFGTYLFSGIMKRMNLESLNPLKVELENHPIFDRINSLDELKVFMDHHVFAVWDFMSLLKKLQYDLVPHGSPWLPNSNGNLVRFINEIVMEEESDLSFAKGEATEYSSHFEIYLQAMREVGVSTAKVEQFLSIVQTEGLMPALNWSELPEPSRAFMKHTFELINSGKSHEIASSFAIARESVVPLMFQRILDQSQLSSDQVPVFRYYLQRHAELDGDHHGPMGIRLLENMCDEDPIKESEVLEQAKASIQQRIKLWNGVLQVLPQVAVPI